MTVESAPQARTSEVAADLRGQTPAQIDAELNRIGYEHAVLVARADDLRSAAEKARESQRPNPAHAERLDDQADQYAPRIAALTAQMKPYEDEYHRRGGWTRAYLVQNNGGHVHSSTHCASCYMTTRYTWLTDYSGKAEDDIVYASGELACTVCYPTAPVNVLKRVGEIRRPSDVEREQRAALKDAKAKAAAAEAVIDPATGKTLYKTARGATNAITSELWNLRWYGTDHPSASRWQKTVADTVAALAAKQDADPTTLMTEYIARADKKFAADARKALREVKKQRGEIVVEDLMPGLQAYVQAYGLPA